MRVLILAAGYGTRLYPLTERIAKPLLPINNKPMMNYLIDKVEFLDKNFSVDEVSIVVNDKFYESFLDWQKKYKVNAKIINDGSKSPDDRLGAIKDMEFAISKSQSDDWLVLGGDNLFHDNLVDFVKFALEKKPYSCLGLYDVESKIEAKRFGVVALDQVNKVIDFKEKPLEPPSTLAASCVYFFPKESLNFMKTFSKNNGHLDAAGKYISWLSKEDKVFGYTLKGKWFDIGHIEALKNAEEEFK